MPRLLQVLLLIPVGYIVTAVVGYFLLLKLSSNQHDRAAEAAMTSIFILGPIGAVVAGAIAFVRAWQ
jgi:nitrogen fixation-related uncharacterized protein